MADFRKSFFRQTSPLVCGEVWTTPALAILIVASRDGNILDVETFNLHNRCWGDYPVTGEIENRMDLNLNRVNDHVATIEQEQQRLKARS